MGLPVHCWLKVRHEKYYNITRVCNTYNESFFVSIYLFFLYILYLSILGKKNTKHFN